MYNRKRQSDGVFMLGLVLMVAVSSLFISWLVWLITR